jgi:hypothetical protein
MKNNNVVCDRSDRKMKNKFFVRDEVARERKKGVCERSDKKMKNKIFVKDEVTGKRKTNRVPVREVIGK